MDTTVAKVRTTEERLARLEKGIKSIRSEMQDLWDRINSDSDAQAQFADETRDIAERARRAATRLGKKLDQLLEE